MKTPQHPHPELASALHIPEIWLKREDLHPYGSHKGRSIPIMVKEYAKMGIKNFVISSSGNAALAALIAVQKHTQNNPGSSVSLTIFVGEHIDEKKLETLKEKITATPYITIKQVENPKQQAFQMENASTDPETKLPTIKNLRQSTDELALKGYLELAEDLSKILNLQAVFIPTSSGTTAQALGEAFLKMNLPIQIHIVQTTLCHPIAEVFDTEVQETVESLAGAIVDKIAHRKEKVVEVVKSTHGSGWIVTNEQILSAVDLIQNTCKFSVSSNSALSLAGLQKAVTKGWRWNGAVCCLITGK